MKRTPEIIEKRRVTMHQRRVERFRKAFKELGWCTDTATLARHMDYNPSSLARILREPLADHVRKIDDQNVFTWEWIDKAPSRQSGV